MQQINTLDITFNAWIDGDRQAPLVTEGLRKKTLEIWHRLRRTNLWETASGCIDVAPDAKAWSSYYGSAYDRARGALPITSFHQFNEASRFSPPSTSSQGTKSEERADDENSAEPFDFEWRDLLRAEAAFPTMVM